MPSQEFEHQIDKYFSEADIILLLVSSDFIASDYCYQIEMNNALERHKRGEAVMIPVILRECAWHELPFGSIMAATIDAKPITKFATHDEGYVQVVSAVSRAIAEMKKKKLQQSKDVDSFAPPKSQTIDAIFTPRSSNLSLPKKFTDLDKDRARREGFEYVAKYFENTLVELKRRNAELDTEFYQPDTNSFICGVYINGEKVGQCGIWRTSHPNLVVEDICFSYSGITLNSFNDSLSVSDNGQTLGFYCLIGGYGKNEPLTNEGMAEYLWDKFFTPIQQCYR